MVFLRDKYAVVRLNIPHIGGNKKPFGGKKKQVCELYHDIDPMRDSIPGGTGNPIGYGSKTET